MSATSWKMGRDVGLISAKCARAVGCPVCGIGIAIDVVGRRYGESPYDWRAKHEGHDCANVRYGLTEEKAAAIKKIGKWIETAPAIGGSVQVPLPDPRLPPEDDDVPF